MIAMIVRNQDRLDLRHADAVFRQRFHNPAGAYAGINQNAFVATANKIAVAAASAGKTAKHKRVEA